MDASSCPHWRLIANSQHFSGCAFIKIPLASCCNLFALSNLGCWIAKYIAFWYKQTPSLNPEYYEMRAHCANEQLGIILGIDFTWLNYWIDMYYIAGQCARRMLRCGYWDSVKHSACWVALPNHQNINIGRPLFSDPCLHFLDLAMTSLIIF